MLTWKNVSLYRILESVGTGRHRVLAVTTISNSAQMISTLRVQDILGGYNLHQTIFELT